MPTRVAIKVIQEEPTCINAVKLVYLRYPDGKPPPITGFNAINNVGLSVNCPKVVQEIYTNV